MAPVELRMDVHCYKCAKKIRKSLENLRGVRRVTASPEQGLVVVYGTADPYTLRRRLERKMERPVEIVSHGSAPYYYYQDTTCAPHYYGPPPAPPPPPAGSYPYAAQGYGAGWADQDPYCYRYRQHSPEPSCSVV